MPKSVFVSYSRKDARWLERLRVHLTPFVRGGVLEIWDDTKITPGARWRAEIERALSRAAASIVLVSPDFLASDFVAVHELPQLLRKAEREGTPVMPIVVEACELALHPALAALQALHAPGRPLSRLRRPASEQVLATVAARIGALVADDAPPRLPPRDDGDSRDTSLLDDLLLATVTLSMLCALEGAEPMSLTELERTLRIRSRKRAFEALEQLTNAGWVERRRTTRPATFVLTPEGARQRQRLSAACVGPLSAMEARAR